MKAIFTLFWQICRLKQSPEYVPTQGWFVLLIIAGNLLCSVLVSAAVSEQLGSQVNDQSAPPVPLLATATNILVGQTTIAVLTWLALQLRELGQRYIETITAIFGCDLLITACFGVMLPLLSMFPPIRALVFLLFLLWSISVMGYILHRALQVQLSIGILSAVGMSIVGLALSEIAIGST